MAFGHASDPKREGLLTGAEAQEWGKYMQTRAEELKERSSELLCEGEEAFCELFAQDVKMTNCSPINSNGAAKA